MTGEKWVVYWNEYSSDTYLYGSKITYHTRDDVEFENRRMPSGTIIKQWYSRTNYQRQKIEPALPMSSINVDCPAGEAWLARLVFFDRYETEAGSRIIRDTVTDFQCPLKTYSYRLQLINGGLTRFHFHSIVIQEIEDEMDGEDQKTE